MITHAGRVALVASYLILVLVVFWTTWRLDPSAAGERVVDSIRESCTP